jgi:hypothetical protein
MNSDWGVAMGMPPYEVFAVARAEVGNRTHIDGESPDKGNCDQ